MAEQKDPNMHLLAARMAAQMIQNAGTSTVARRTLANALGQQFGDDRDLYYVLGYKKELTIADYEERWSRQDIADRVVRAFPEATWKGRPEVYETEDPDEVTAFEESWARHLASFSPRRPEMRRKQGSKVWSYLRRVDILAGIGRYAVLYVGLDDSDDPSRPVEPGENRRVLYHQPFRESNVGIVRRVTNRKDPRFGLPEMYSLDPGTGATFNAHYTRVVHVADNTEESDVFGVPRMKKVFNRLMDIEKIAGPSAEAFWRNVYPGLSFEMDPMVELKAEDRAALQDEIEEYVHGMNRYLMLQGIETKQLRSQPTDPMAALTAQVNLISSQTGIPSRILMGSERGELASTQDRENWNDRIDERRANFAEPCILEPYIDLLLDAGVLQPPTDEEGWSVRWPAHAAMTQTERSEVDLNRAKTLSEYTRNAGAESVVPPLIFLTEHMGYSDDLASEALEQAGRELGSPEPEEDEDEE